MRADLPARFRAAVTERLRPLGPALVPVLQQLVGYQYPKQVVAIEFQVFCDGFTQEFPVRAFFLDEANSEVFVAGSDGPEYPSPVDPGLLSIQQVYDQDLEAPFLTEDDNLDVYTLAGEALIPWFAECWKLAGGASFPLIAAIALHDDDRCFDLVHDVWQSLQDAAQHANGADAPLSRDGARLIRKR